MGISEGGIVGVSARGARGEKGKSDGTGSVGGKRIEMGLIGLK